MKTFLCLMMLVSSLAHAESCEVVKPLKKNPIPLTVKQPDISANIVVPSLASGVTRFTKYHNSNGSMVVCPTNNSWLEPQNVCYENGKSMWIKIEESVPASRKFVGFNVYGASGVIFVYWK